MQGAEYPFFAIGLGIFVSMAGWSLVAFRLATRRRFDLLDIFLLAFGTVYGAASSFIIWATETGQNPGGIRIIGKETSYWIVPSLALFCILGWLAFANLGVRSNERQRRPASASLNLSELAWRPYLVFLGWALLAVAVLSSFLYTRAYGGFAGFFEVAGALRAGLFEEAGANPLSFLKPFGGFSLFASYLFSATWVTAESGRRAPSVVGFAISVALSSATLLGWGGRVDLLVYWMTLVLGALIYRYGVLPRLLTWAAVLVVTLVMVMPPLTDAMNPGKSHGDYTQFFATELTFPFESSLHALDLQEYRHGLDLLVAPLFVLPERIWSELDVRNVSDLNSEVLLGDRLREGFGFTIPADMMTFSLYQGGLPAVLLVGLLWCAMLTALDRVLVERVPRSISAFLYAHAVFSVAALSVLYFDPKMQIARNFHFIFGSLAVLSIPAAASLFGVTRTAGQLRQ